MFTGIITEIGSVKSLRAAGGGLRLAVNSKDIRLQCRIGGSVSVNGVCLTVVEKTSAAIEFDVMAETVKNSSLAYLKENSPVNLEGSMRSDGTFGGHFVLGHVDCVGTIRGINKREGNFSIEIKIPEEFSMLVVDKGSVAVDGVSLTAGDPGRDSFKVHIIPHTLKETILHTKKTGDRVNIEFDIIGKYALRSSELKIRDSKLSERYLTEKGFI